MSDLSRQSFLGADSDNVLKSLTIGLVGLGGGGSHVAQQLAHLGVGKFVMVDPDVIEDSNLNRLVGGTAADVRKGRAKVEIARRLVLGVRPRANVIRKHCDWREALDELKGCDMIVGGLDSVRAKAELDAFCRRFLIPYVDMGMDVHELGDHFLIAGQVVLSTPRRPCLRCFGIVTDEALEREGARYGAAGGKPQVVWPNGALASIAVGLVAQTFTPWHSKPVETAFLEYDGNRNTVSISPRLTALKDHLCPHHDAAQTGDAFFDLRTPWMPPQASERRIGRILDWIRSFLPDGKSQAA
jgi:hypothetical protein